MDHVCIHQDKRGKLTINKWKERMMANETAKAKQQP